MLAFAIGVAAQRSGLEQAVGGLCVGETSHGDSPLHRGAAAADTVGVIVADRDRNHLEVDVWGEPAVELQFPFAEALARLQGSEIQKAEVDRLIAAA